jgi:hypothetical protein
MDEFFQKYFRALLRGLGTIDLCYLNKIQIIGNDKRNHAGIFITKLCN